MRLTYQLCWEPFGFYLEVGPYWSVCHCLDTDVECRPLMFQFEYTQFQRIVFQCHCHHIVARHVLAVYQGLKCVVFGSGCAAPGHRDTYMMSKGHQDCSLWHWGHLSRTSLLSRSHASISLVLTQTDDLRFDDDAGWLGLCRIQYKFIEYIQSLIGLMDLTWR